MEPRRQRVGSGCTKGDGSLAGPLAEDGGDPGVQVDIVDIEPGKLADPNAAGIQQLEDGAIPQAASIVALAWPVVSTTGRWAARLALTSRTAGSPAIRPDRCAQS